MKEKILSILNSIKFWEVVVLALAAYVEVKGFIGEAERNLIMTILGVSVSIDTLRGTARKLSGK